MLSDAKIYCRCMEGVRHRLRVVQTILAGGITTGHDHLNTELIFVQLRKALEEIAFASLSANKDKYSSVHANFADFWRAKELLKEIRQVNPNFYPVPIRVSTRVEDDVITDWRFEPIAEDFLKEEDFFLLYDKSSQVLHTRNPYRAGEAVSDIKYDVPGWIRRIQKLLSFHLVHLVDETDSWIVQIPNEGHVTAHISRLVPPSV
jgi:hypothetical protein